MQLDRLKRSEFITLLGGAAACAVSWPLTARAQQPMMPVVGFLSTRGPSDDPHLVAAVRQGLQDAGYIEGQSVAIEYRFAEHQNDRLPALAADLVRRRVTVITAGPTPAALAAKAATSTIPIVFEVATDPVALGLVASLNRPGGIITGVTNLGVEIAPKRLEMMRELLPTATNFALLINPTSPAVADTLLRDSQAAADRLGLKLHVLNASADRDLEPAFADLARLRADALVIGSDPFFTARAEQLGTLAVRHAVPAAYEYREFAVAGGLLGFGSRLADAYRLAGLYTGRVLKGEKPANLPVQRSTRVELIINLKTAKALGINIPLPLVGRADEVIE
jgi:putative ABC transport system substrate-binding protein